MQVVVGAGPVGTTVARLLAERGEDVKLVTRSGGGPEHPAITKVAADATDPAALSAIASGASSLLSCGGPPYPRWAAEWPPLGASLIAAAEKTGAVLVSTGNLYPYGEPSGPIREQDPERPNSVKGAVRAKLWADALAAHQAGRIRTAEVRGSDYLGAGAASFFTIGVLPGVLKGKKVAVPADLDAPHSWTAVQDVARTLVAVAGDEAAWGRTWLVPTPPPVSLRDLAARAAELAGAPPARLTTMPPAVLWIGGLFDQQAKEIRELQYQVRRPFVIDSGQAERAFGLRPTPTDDALRDTVNAV
ncbi:NAD-dependent epimerase/dehydratase [Kribbella flavida DSM 17836]|uniref:NAD-dependent epimerase/dehydratase n=1 Tax=Kribbella flavida (strain DSM 17836 / JCM 10339 / NBRC 14399) TaxID=479435 RepID=D2Q486_KRIFD|nr:NAD-dependent epimerase/dehydratase family protein [Kribbella flavida]ADB30400.1 NAD-dependent epimerase/dehydratase [Kribbella flavida DSM 17836]